ncbi:MAG: hypothetical protein GY847_34405 [Proteobacteria bacterium]|nr:hypothetical protein [Pseudomonadota bacterium]
MKLSKERNGLNKRPLLPILCLVATILGCDGFPDIANLIQDCRINESQACYCSPSERGVQYCQPQGGKWDVCLCDDVCQISQEICDGLDNNCDGATDENAVDSRVWYADLDGDTYGDLADTQQSCNAPEGYVADSSDCDDRPSHIGCGANCHPAQTEICDGWDNDCNPDTPDCNPGDLIWIKQAGNELESSTGYGEGAYGIDGFDDGSFVIAGAFRGDATFGAGETNQTVLNSLEENADDIFIARFNPDGSLAWARRAGGPGESNETALHVVTLKDGSVAMTGVYNSNAVFGEGEQTETTLPQLGAEDIFIARYSVDGNLLWAKHAGGTGWDMGSDITALPDGSLVLTGYFGYGENSAVFGSGEPNETVLESVGEFDFYIAKYQSNGMLAWARRAGGPRGDLGMGVAANPDGSILVTGTFGYGGMDTAVFGAGEPNETAIVGDEADVFIARYNSDGTLDWVNRAGGAGIDSGIDISPNNDNTAFFVSGSFGTAGFTATFGEEEPNETTLSCSESHEDAFIAKYNMDGTLIWAKGAGGNGLDSGASIGITPDDSIVMVGIFVDEDLGATFGLGEPNETTLLGVDNSVDSFIASYNSDGALLYARPVIGPGWDAVNDILVLGDGSAIATGYVSETAVFGVGESNETTLTSAGARNIFVAKFHTPTN